MRDFFIDQHNVSLRCGSSLSTRWVMKQRSALILTSHIVHTNTCSPPDLTCGKQSTHFALSNYSIPISVLWDKELVQFERNWFTLLQSWPDTQVLSFTQKMPIRFSSSCCVQYSLTISLHIIFVYYFDENVTIIILLIKLNWVKLVRVTLCSFYRKKLKALNKKGIEIN